MCCLRRFYVNSRWNVHQNNFCPFYTASKQQLNTIKANYANKERMQKTFENNEKKNNVDVDVGQCF